MLKPGMVFTIEPMINTGVWKDVTWPDDWTSATEDGKRSAQFEHTILVTDTSFEILTARTSNSLPFFWETTPAIAVTNSENKSESVTNMKIQQQPPQQQPPQPPQPQTIKSKRKKKKKKQPLTNVTTI